MNTYQLAALQLQLLQRTDEPPTWLGSVSKPSHFSDSEIVYHKGNGQNCLHNYATNATETSYVWDMGNAAEQFCFGTQ